MVAAARIAQSGDHRSHIVAFLLGITQTVGYGTLYYAFGVLAPAMAADTGYSLTSVYGFFSIGLAASGFFAPRIGRLLDRHSPARLMTAGSALCAAMLVAWALVPGRTAFAAFTILVELSSILVLYEAAFVAVAKTTPAAQARRTITGITLVAGFASTIFWPLTHWLSGFLDWREVCLVYAAMQIAICLPLHALLWRAFPAVNESATDEAKLETIELGEVRDEGLRRRIFLLLIVGFAAQSFVIAAVHLHLIGLLGGLGLAGSAALIGALLGPSQVLARIAEFAGSSRFSTRPALLFSSLALPVSLLILFIGAPALAPAVTFAVIFGAGQGLSYVLRGIMPLQIFGRNGYGQLTGWLNSARLYVASAAPFATAILFENAGVYPALAFIIALGAISGTVLVLASSLAHNASRRN